MKQIPILVCADVDAEYDLLTRVFGFEPGELLPGDDGKAVHGRSEMAMTSSGGADIVYEPIDQPYGYREYSARDSEGHLWLFMKPLG